MQMYLYYLSCPPSKLYPIRSPFLNHINVTACLRNAIFFPRVILYNFFLLLVIFGLGFWGLGFILGIRGWEFQLMWFGACGVGTSGFLGWGSLYIH